MNLLWNKSWNNLAARALGLYRQCPNRTGSTKSTWNNDSQVDMTAGDSQTLKHKTMSAAIVCKCYKVVFFSKYFTSVVETSPWHSPQNLLQEEATKRGYAECSPPHCSFPHPPAPPKNLFVDSFVNHQTSQSSVCQQPKQSRDWAHPNWEQTAGTDGIASGVRTFCGCQTVPEHGLIPGNAHGQVGWGSEWPDLAEDTPPPSRDDGLHDI